MRTWIITEDDISYFINNCDELLSSAKASVGLSQADHCIIREKRTDNPLCAAIFEAVTVLDQENSISFLRAFRSILHEYNNWKDVTLLELGPPEFRAINKKAVIIDG